MTVIKAIGVLAIIAATGSTPASAQAKVYFCSAYTQFRGTMWITRTRPAGPDLDALRRAWVEHVRANFIPNAGPNGPECDVGTADAMAGLRKSRIEQLLPKQVIDVDWSFWKNAETEPAAAALNQAAAAGQYVLCYSNVGQSPVYLSSDIHIDVPLGPDPHSSKSDGRASARALDELKTEFLSYLQAAKGYHSTSSYPAYCVGRISTADLAANRELLRRRFPQVTLVETGWKPGMKAAGGAAGKPPGGTRF